MIIAIANRKGGVGKTTLAVHLATWLSRQGRPVALIDLDTQGSVAYFLGLEPANDVAELFRAVLDLRPDRRPPLRAFLTPVPGYGEMAVIRGWDRSTALEADLRRPEVGPPGMALREILAPLLSVKGLCIVLDTGPYAGKVQEAALAVSDYVLVPGIPEAATEAGVLDIARRLKELGRRITAIVPTKFVQGAREHMQTIRDWREALGPIVYYEPREHLYGLPRRVVWGEIVRHGRPIWDIAPKDPAAREMETVVRRIAYDTQIE